MKVGDLVRVKAFSAVWGVDIIGIVGAGFIKWCPSCFVSNATTEYLWQYQGVSK